MPDESCRKCGTSLEIRRTAVIAVSPELFFVPSACIYIDSFIR